MCNKISPCPCLAVALCPCRVLGHPGPRGACRVEGHSPDTVDTEPESSLQSRAVLVADMSPREQANGREWPGQSVVPQPAARPLQGGAGGRCQQRGWGQHCYQKGGWMGWQRGLLSGQLPGQPGGPGGQTGIGPREGTDSQPQSWAGECAWSHEGSGSNTAATPPDPDA